MLKRTMSIVLSVMMILSIFTIIPVTTSSAAPSDSVYGWHPVTADEVVSGDMVIITMATKNGVYGLSSANGSSSAPGAVLFTVLSNQEATQEKLAGSSDDISACSLQQHQQRCAHRRLGNRQDIYCQRRISEEFRHIQISRRVQQSGLEMLHLRQRQYL